MSVAFSNIANRFINLVSLQWRIIYKGDWKWFFQNVATGQYLYIDGYAQNGTPFLASDNKTGFNIWPDERDNAVYRYGVPRVPMGLLVSVM